MRRWTEWDHLDNSRLFFCLNSVTYRNGTIVKFTNDYMNSYHKGKYPHGVFCYKEEHNDVYVFYTRALTGNKMQCGYFRVQGNDLCNVIDEITHPFVITINISKPNSIFDVPRAASALGAYILIMFFSMVFNDFILIWMIATFVLVKFYKNQMRPRYYMQDG